MTDLRKRQTLKLIGGTGIGAGTLASPLAASVLTPQQGIEKLAAKSRRSGSADLQIDIISTTAIPEQSVIITNHTDGTLEINRFLPGTVVFKDSMVDLNSVLDSGPISLKPDHSMSANIEIWNLLARPIIEYVWAADSVSPLSNETDVISVGAFVADRKGIVFPLEVRSNLVA